MALVERLGHAQMVLNHARPVLLDLCHSFPVVAGCYGLKAILAVANWTAHQSCSFAAAVVPALLVAEDAAVVVGAVHIDRSEVGALVYFARKVLVALEVELGVLGHELAMPRDLECHVQMHGTRRVVEGPVAGPVAQAHYTVIAAAWSALEALLQRRRAALRGSRTRWTSTAMSVWLHPLAVVAHGAHRYSHPNTSPIARDMDDIPSRHRSHAGQVARACPYQA